MSSDQSQAAYAASAADLALRALDALHGIEGTAMVAEHVEGADDPKAALAAIRVIGADLFAPCLLGDAVFSPQDAAAVAQSFTVFPAAVSTPPPPPAGAPEPWLVAWRDWATATLLARFTGPAATASAEPVDAPGTPGTFDGSGTEPSEGVLAPRPAEAPALSEPDHHSPATATAHATATGTGTSAGPDTGAGWQRWSVRMGQLSPSPCRGSKDRSGTPPVPPRWPSRVAPPAPCCAATSRPPPGSCAGWPC
ncbi:hypothetical protein ACOBQB_01360 [Streptomyces sp. G5(2025)]|uniref:hypothetical protein n=1 Tax=Streptomyces sp. G5(2025) TaxID=3406628 RepID=UPI003C27B590